MPEGLSKTATNLRAVDIPYEMRICHSHIQVRNVANWARVFSTLVLFERKTGAITCTCINSMLILKRINNFSCDIIEVLTTKLWADFALFPFLRFTEKKGLIQPSGNTWPNDRFRIQGRGNAVSFSPSFTGRLLVPHPLPRTFPLRINLADRERA